eukprot:473432_1
MFKRAWFGDKNDKVIEADSGATDERLQRIPSGLAEAIEEVKRIFQRSLLAGTDRKSLSSVNFSDPQSRGIRFVNLPARCAGKPPSRYNMGDCIALIEAADNLAIRTVSATNRCADAQLYLADALTVCEEYSKTVPVLYTDSPETTPIDPDESRLIVNALRKCIGTVGTVLQKASDNYKSRQECVSSSIAEPERALSQPAVPQPAVSEAAVSQSTVAQHTSRVGRLSSTAKSKIHDLWTEFGWNPEPLTEEQKTRLADLARNLNLSTERLVNVCIRENKKRKAAEKANRVIQGIVNQQQRSTQQVGSSQQALPVQTENHSMVQPLPTNSQQTAISTNLPTMIPMTMNMAPPLPINYYQQVPFANAF